MRPDNKLLLQLSLGAITAAGSVYLASTRFNRAAQPEPAFLNLLPEHTDTVVETAAECDAMVLHYKGAYYLARYHDPDKFETIYSIKKLKNREEAEREANRRVFVPGRGILPMNIGPDPVAEHTQQAKHIEKILDDYAQAGLDLRGPQP